MSKDKDLTLQQLRAKYPRIKAVSKKAFLLKLAKVEQGAVPPAPPAEGTTEPKKEEKPAEAKKKTSAVPKGGLTEVAAQYKDQNDDFIEQVSGGAKQAIIIAGSPSESYYKVLLFRGKYGPTQTLHASRGKKLEEVRAIAKTL